jgi:hypothetical protein
MAASRNVIILKWRERLVLVYAARWRLCEKMAGNSLKWWLCKRTDGRRAQRNNIKMAGKVSVSLCRKMAVV